MTGTPWNGGFRWFLQLVTSIAVTILLPGVGFLASEVIATGKGLAVVEQTKINHQQMLEAIEAHRSHGVHPGAALKSELREAIEQLERQQAIRDDNIRRELTEIKESLQKLRKQ